MDLIDRMKDIASRIPKQMEYTQTEEATKNAFIWAMALSQLKFFDVTRTFKK